MDAVQKFLSEATQSYIREFFRYTLNFAPHWIEAGMKSLLSIENVVDTS